MSAARSGNGSRLEGSCCWECWLKCRGCCPSGSGYPEFFYSVVTIYCKLTAAGLLESKNIYHRQFCFTQREIESAFCFTFFFTQREKFQQDEVLFKTQNLIQQLKKPGLQLAYNRKRMRVYFVLTDFTPICQSGKSAEL